MRLNIWTFPTITGNIFFKLQIYQANFLHFLTNSEQEAQINDEI